MPIYRWHQYKHSFSKTLVEELVKQCGVKENGWVLDPFCGSGTTLLSCRDLGINSIGYDISPYAVFLSNAKLELYSVGAIDKEIKRFLRHKSLIDHAPNMKIGSDIPTLHKAFSESTWAILSAIKDYADKIETKSVQTFFLMGLLGILERVSNTVKAGGFLRIVPKRIRKNEIIELFLLQLNEMRNDIVHSETSEGMANSKAVLGDARTITAKKHFDAIITSPPYPNRHDYTRTYCLELGMLFIQSNSILKNLRYDTLRSHVEAKKRFEAEGYLQTQEATRLLTSLSKKTLNNKAVLPMLHGYFEDMYLAMSAMSNTLEKGGWLAMAIGNVRYAGINIPVDEIIAEIGLQVGLTPRHIWTARLKGNSSQQKHKDKREPSRESIVFWQRSYRL